MAIKQQISKLKENWLLLVVVLVVMGLFTFWKAPLAGFDTFDIGYQKVGGTMMEESIASRSAIGIMPPYYGNGDFAPGVTERKITKSASLSNEIRRGEFDNAQARTKSIIKSTDSYLLNENVYIYDTRHQTHTGSYQIQVETSKYDAVLSQLKEIGEIASFSENAEDITGSYTNLEAELETEKARLVRYKEMLSSASTTTEKIELADRIYDLERRIKYLEDALKNTDLRIEYTAIYFQLTEKPSGYADVVFLSFADLIRNLVNSFNNLLKLVFAAIPYLVALIVVWVGVRIVRRKKR